MIEMITTAGSANCIIYDHILSVRSSFAFELFCDMCDAGGLCLFALMIRRAEA